MGIFFFPDWRFQRHRFLGYLHDFPDPFDRNIHFFRDFFRQRFPSFILQELAGNADQFIDRFYHVHRDTDGAGLVGNSAGNSLADPPRGIGTEFIAFTIVKFIDRFQQPQIAFLYQIQEKHAPSDIPFGNTDDKTQIGIGQLLFGDAPRFDLFFCCIRGIAPFDSLGQRNFLFR